jgi:glycosyltransferase involved in cell wall biosynthesis
MSLPLISVILCVRDGGDYLCHALDSVEAQNVQGVEVVVIDDGSTDDSAEIAGKHSVAATVLREKRLGLPRALNHGLIEARGSFVTFIDADDVWPADRLVKMVAAFDRSPNIDGVYGAFINTDAKLRPVGPPLSARCLGTMLISRASALKIGDFRTDVAHGANVDWISRALTIGLRFAPVDAIVAFRRIHSNNMGVRDQRRSRQDLLRVIRDHHARKTQK